MTQIILVRHGETTWNDEGRYQGQEDTPLSKRGIEQGHLLAMGLANIHIDACISSPLKRAFNTCSFCADLHGLPVTTDPRLMEISHGAWEGAFSHEIAQKYPEEFALWQKEPHKVKMPDGESLEDVRKRAREAIDEYVQKYENKTILVAAHDAVNKVLICDVLGLGMEHFWQIKQDNTCINVLEYSNDMWRTVLINSTNHMGYLFSGIEQAGL